MQERLEIDYWKKYGLPEHIEGHLHKSTINKGEFYMTYLKEKNPHTNLQDRVYKTMWATRSWRIKKKELSIYHLVDHNYYLK